MGNGGRPNEVRTSKIGFSPRLSNVSTIKDDRLKDALHDVYLDKSSSVRQKVLASCPSFDS